MFRRTGADGPWVYLGGTGLKRITDVSVPAGATNLTYQLQAVRSTVTGPWAQFNVTFGVPEVGGAATALVVAAPAPVAAPKLAA